MNSISYLNQAKLADSLGKYKLADNLYEKAVRLAAPPPGFVPIAETAAREAAEAALKAAFESGVEADIRRAMLGYGFTEEGIAAIERKLGSLGRMTNVNINTLIGEASGRTVEIASSEIFFKGNTVPLGKMNITELQNFLLENREALSASQINKVLAALRRRLNKPENLDVTVSQDIVDIGLEARYLRPRPRPTPRPEPTPETPTPEPPSSELPSEVEGMIEKIKNRFTRKPKNVETELPKQKSKLLKWAKGLGAAALLTYGLILVGDKLYHSDSGKEINYLDPDWNRLGLPDFRMYNDRMKAGQQKAQEPKALAFIEKHKNNSAIKDQRDWYNLALQESKKEGNDPKTVKNFANDVIAIIKKSPLTQGFNADRNAPRS